MFVKNNYSRYGSAIPTEKWENITKYKLMNNRWGNCNTGARVKGVCVLGGIGCNVDHVSIKLENERC